MQACAIRQHQECTVHRVAKSLFLSPDRPVSELLPYDLKDQDLFRGNVPQPADWLRAWSACKRVTSFRSAAQHFQTEDYAWGRRCSVVAKSFLSAIMYLLVFATLCLDTGSLLFLGGGSFANGPEACTE